MSSMGSTGRKAAALCLALLVGWAAARAGELVITSKDVAREVGDRARFALAAADGNPRPDVRYVIIGRRTVGPRTLLREVVFIGPMRVAGSWIATSEAEHAFYSSFDAPRPRLKYPLPLKKGLTYQYESARGKVRARVEGPVAVEVPAGKFECLLIVEDHEDGEERWQQKLWLAPRVGPVKYILRNDQDYTLTLVSRQEPRQVKAQPGTAVVSTFDVGDPFGSPLFPRATWNAGAGKPGCSSVIDIDPSGGAAGTPFCLRWTYHTQGTWVNVSLIPSGVWGVPVDLSRYGSMSFYIKGLVPGTCSLTVMAKPAEGDGRRFRNIPIQVGAEWRKIVIGIKTHPQLKEMDLKQAYMLAFSAYSEGEASGVISIDEVMFHTAEKVGEF